MPMFMMLLVCAAITFPVGYAIVLRLDLRRLGQIMGVGMALYLADALLIAGAIMLSEPYPEGLLSLLLGVAQLALMGVFISSPLGVPLVVGLAFLMRRRLRAHDAKTPTLEREPAPSSRRSRRVL